MIEIEMFPAGVGSYEMGLDICWASAGLHGEQCLYSLVGDFGLCLVCYFRILGRSPVGYTETDVDVERKRRRKEEKKLRKVRKAELRKQRG